MRRAGTAASLVLIAALVAGAQPDEGAVTSDEDDDEFYARLEGAETAPETARVSVTLGGTPGSYGYGCVDVSDLCSPDPGADALCDEPCSRCSGACSRVYWSCFRRADAERCASGCAACGVFGPCGGGPGAWACRRDCRAACDACRQPIRAACRPQSRSCMHACVLDHAPLCCSSRRCTFGRAPPCGDYEVELLRRFAAPP